MYKVNVLYSCKCIVIEKMETLAHRPRVGEVRQCPFHKRRETIVRIGEPWKDQKKIEAK